MWNWGIYVHFDQCTKYIFNAYPILGTVFNIKYALGIKQTKKKNIPTLWSLRSSGSIQICTKYIEKTFYILPLLIFQFLLVVSVTCTLHVLSYITTCIYVWNCLLLNPLTFSEVITPFILGNISFTFFIMFIF